MSEESLSERLGGVFAIAAVVDRFSDAIFDDPVAGVLSRTLDELGVPQREKDEVLGAFAAHKGEVTEGALATA